MTPLPASPILSRFQSLVDLAPEAVALIDSTDGTITTRGALLDRAVSVHRKTLEEGVEAGDIVALRMRNSADLVAAILGAWMSGAAVAPLDRDARESEVANVLHQFQAGGLLWSEDGQIRLRRETYGSGGHETAVLIKLSSGSTGIPKGIRTSAANLVADCRNIIASMEIRPEDVNLGAIPMTHSYGFSNLLMPLLLQGTAVVTTNDYLPLALLELANRHRCTVLPGVPMMFDHLSRLPETDGRFETVRTAISAGAPLRGESSKAFRERFGLTIHSFYGASECGGITYDYEGGAVERGHVGRALSGVRLSIDPEAGTLVVHSDAVAEGYTGVETQDERFGRRSYRTDDLVSIARDGTVTLEGRAGDLINVAGRKVNPREVEAVLLELEAIAEVKAYGEPAGARGEVVAAVVVARGEISREALRDHCRQRLSAYKVPRIIKFVEAIPLDSRGKVRRGALAAL